MTGFPYPEVLRDIHAHFVAGRREQARALFYRWLPLIRYESQPGSVPGTSLAIRKEILRRRGWITSACVRPPATALDAATRWRAFAVAGASPAQSRVALVAHRGFFLLSQRVRNPQPTGYSPAGDGRR